MLQSLRQWIMKHPSKAAWWFLLVGTLLVNIQAARWTKGNILRQDVVQYYSFLPAVFVHHDVSMRYCHGNNYYRDKVWGQNIRPGLGPVQKYTMGMAVMYTPWFLVAHAHAHVGGWTPDGYTQPYRFWLQWGMWFYLMVGLWFLRKVLLRFCPEWPVAFTLVGILLGTNLLYYVIGDPGMPHTSMFMLVSMLMWVSVRFYEDPSWRMGLALACIGSLITLVRPNHLLLWGIPALAGIGSWADFKARLAFWRLHWGKLLLWPLVGFLFLLPQFLYWKHLTGHFLYYSYQKEGFFFGSPAVWEVLFGFRKGLLVYSPIMLFGFAGLLLLRKKAREWTLAVPVTVAVSGYVIAAWWCWWYGGSFGMRAFVDLFPMLAVGMALAFDWMQVGRKKWNSWIVAGMIGGFCLLNWFQTYQYHRGLLHYDSMTARAYVGIFGRIGAPDHLQEWLEAPDYEAAMRGE